MDKVYIYKRLWDPNFVHKIKVLKNQRLFNINGILNVLESLQKIIHFYSIPPVILYEYLQFLVEKQYRTGFSLDGRFQITFKK